MVVVGGSRKAVGVLLGEHAQILGRILLAAVSSERIWSSVVLENDHSAGKLAIVVKVVVGQ